MNLVEKGYFCLKFIKMQLPFFLADYLKGKTMYPSIRRGLNLLFSISITSFLFEKIYFTYSWPDITNYKLILDFFIKGQFIVPFSIFLVVHGITYFIPSVIFSLYNFRKSVKLTREIVAYEVGENTINDQLRRVKILSKNVSPVVLTKEALVDLYLQFKDNLTAESLDELQKSCDEEKAKLEENFIFAFRTLVFIGIYFSVISYFGWVLLIITLFVVLGYMILLLIGYQFFDLFPMAVRKFKYEADKYVHDYLKNQNSVDS